MRLIKSKIIFDNFIQKYMSEMKTGLKIIKRDKNGIYTDNGFVPFEDIQYVDIIGYIEESK